MFARIFTIVSVAMLVAAQPHGRGLPVLGGILGGGGGGMLPTLLPLLMPTLLPSLSLGVTRLLIASMLRTLAGRRVDVLRAGGGGGGDGGRHGKLV